MPGILFSKHVVKKKNDRKDIFSKCLYEMNLKSKRAEKKAS